MSGNIAPNIDTNGLILYLDAANSRSYPTTGTSWFNLISNNFNGIINNGATYTTNFKGGITFDGVDDYVDCGVTDISAGTDFTVDVVASLDGFQVLYADIIDYNHFAGGWVIQQNGYSPNDQFYFAWYNGATYNFSYFSLPIDNTPFNLTIVKTGSTVNNYINGILSTSGTGSSTITLNGLPMYLGSYVPSGRNMKGNIYSTKIYNRPLTSDEVFRNHLSIKSRFGL